MFCPKCGAANDEGNGFCPNCGAKIERVQPTVATEPIAMQPEQQSPSSAYNSLGSGYQTPATLALDQSAKKSKKPIVAIVLVVLALGIGLIGFANPLRLLQGDAKSTAEQAGVVQSANSENAGVGLSSSSSSVVEGESSTEEGDVADGFSGNALGNGGSVETAGESIAEAGESIDSAAQASSEIGVASSVVDSSETASNVLIEEKANRISPKESIVVSDLKITEDPVKRYVLTGKVANVSDETYTVDIDFFATMHYSDKYGEEATKETELEIDEGNVTGHTIASNNTLTIYDLAPTTAGKEKTFTLYPSFGSVEERLSDPVCTVSNVTLPDAQSSWRFDYSDGIKITDQRLTPDGKAIISFVNDTGLYLESAKVSFACYNNEGIPAVYSNSDDRPYGAVVESASAETLKPGDKGTFECEVGEGYSKVEIIDKTITPDQSKNSFN